MWKIVLKRAFIIFSILIYYLTSYSFFAHLYDPEYALYYYLEYDIIYFYVYFTFVCLLWAVRKIFIAKESYKKIINWLFFVTVIFVTFSPSYFLISRPSSILAACEANLKNLATALDMYAEENNNSYPPTLQHLEEKYLEDLPRCPANKRKDYLYIPLKNKTSFILICQGYIHVRIGLAENMPQYSKEEGLTRLPFSPPKKNKYLPIVRKITSWTLALILIILGIFIKYERAILSVLICGNTFNFICSYMWKYIQFFSRIPLYLLS